MPAYKEGMRRSTKLTVLTDGAKNCWSVISSLTSSYYNIITILDWFHIGKQFKNVEHHIPETLRESFDGAKWFLWHGNPEASLERLGMIRSEMDDHKKSISSLMTYIKNNHANIVNYSKREDEGFVYTSQLAESTVNNLVNERQKHDARMQWSRSGADCILQIRSSMHSQDWDEDWSRAQQFMYRKAV